MYHGASLVAAGASLVATGASLVAAGASLVATGASLVAGTAGSNPSGYPTALTDLTAYSGATLPSTATDLNSSAGASSTMRQSSAQPMVYLLLLPMNTSYISAALTCPALSELTSPPPASTAAIKYVSNFLVLLLIINPPFTYSGVLPSGILTCRDLYLSALTGNALIINAAKYHF